MTMPKAMRPYAPNTSDALGLVWLKRPKDSVWPIRLTQIVGGKTWSLTFVRFRTPTPVPTQQFLDDVAAEMERMTEEQP